MRLISGIILILSLSLAGGLFAIAGFTHVGSVKADSPPIFLQLLGSVPDNENNRTLVYLNDYAKARQIIGLRLPGPEASHAALLEYVRGLQNARMGEGPWISGFHMYNEAMEGNRRCLGFDLRDIDQSVLAGQPPNRMEVARGRFTAAQVEGSISGCTASPPPLTQVYGGLTIFIWGNDFAQDLAMRLQPPVFDYLGRGGRIAVKDDLVLRALSTDSIMAMIDVNSSQTPSLADAEDYAAAANGLTTLGAYTALISNLTQSAAKDADAGYPPQEPLLRPYRVLATGKAKDSEGEYMALVLVHQDSEAAAENVDRLGRRIEETSSLRTGMGWRSFASATEAKAEGNLLLAKLRGERMATIWHTWFEVRDPLLAHE